MKENKLFLKVFIYLIFVAGLIVLFVLDDVTVIGYALNFLEFIVATAVGIFGGKKVFKKRR